MFLKKKKLVVASLLSGFLMSFPFTLPAQSNSEQVIDVVVDGAGLSEESAMSNAYQNAVQQAVGLYIDAETLVNNDDLVKEKILTHSRGIIDELEVVSSSNEGGLYRVKVRAKVIKKDLEDRIQPILSDSKSINIDGQSLLAAAESKEQQEKNATELLNEIAKHIKEQTPSWIEFSIDGEPKLSENNDSLQVAIRREFNFNKYLEAIRKPVEILDQIAVSKVDSISQSSESTTEINASRFSNLPEGLNYILVEKWISKNHLQKKWVFYELPIKCDFDYDLKRKAILNLEVKSKENGEVIAVGYKDINVTPNLQSSLTKSSSARAGACFLTHNLQNIEADDYRVFFDLHLLKNIDFFTIDISIDPIEIINIGKVDLSVNYSN